MARGFAKLGAAQEQIDASIEDAIFAFDIIGSCARSHASVVPAHSKHATGGCLTWRLGGNCRFSLHVV